MVTKFWGRKSPVTWNFSIRGPKMLLGSHLKVVDIFGDFVLNMM